MGSVCYGHICILLYMNLIWCGGFPETYGQLEEWGWISLPRVYVHSAICKIDLV